MLKLAFISILLGAFEGWEVGKERVRIGSYVIVKLPGSMKNAFEKSVVWLLLYFSLI